MRTVDKALQKSLYLACVIVMLVLSSCDDFMEADLPSNSIATSQVFTSDNTALAAVSGIYSGMSLITDPVYLSGATMGVMPGLCADELSDLSQDYVSYERNAIPINNFGPVQYTWQSAYSYIYQVNTCLQGLENSTSLSAKNKQQLLGEAYFIRAFCYFYLVNLYGGVPLITNTDYQANATKSRSTVNEVYQQIVADLQKAESFLVVAYPSAEKVRPNKYTASALLARTYLYTQQWAAAEAKASEVLGATYTLEPAVEKVFLKTNSEVIWQLMPVSTSINNSLEAAVFSPERFGTLSYALQEGFLNAFEPGDKRKTAWIASYKNGSQLHYYPAKYKALTTPAAVEYTTVFRLTEQYFIRAEARAQQKKIAEGEADLNAVRNRAGLKNLSETITVDQASLLQAIEQERRVELFAEWGHRWFDLLRTGRADAVLSAAKPGNWKPHAKLWPIPLTEVQADPNIKQNEGY